jgi:hypothetical protein
LKINLDWRERRGRKERERGSRGGGGRERMERERERERERGRLNIYNDNLCDRKIITSCFYYRHDCFGEC